MRTFLLTVFWVTNFGSVIQLLVMASAGWIIFYGDYSFYDLNVGVFVTKIVPWFLWMKTFIVAVFGEFGWWILSVPILLIAPMKLIAGTIIGLWAYSVARDLPAEPAYIS